MNTATGTLVHDAADQLQSVIDANGYRTTFTYDAVGRLKSETLPGTLPGPWGYPTAVVTNYAYDGNGNLTSVTDPLGHATATTFDTLNRPVAVARQADWSTTLRTTFTYDAVGNRTVVQDGLDHRTTVAYDVRNRPVAETRPAGGGTTTFTYDLAGRLTGVKDPVGNLTSYTYDTADRLTVATDPLGKRTTHAYDPVGNRTTTTDRLGRIRQFAYDADDRLVTEAWKPVGGGATIRTVTWTYDDAGRLTGVKDPDSQYAYAYDNADRLTGVDNAGSPGMPSVALTYTYDPAGNRTAVQDSLGGRTSYAYDVRNWLTDIKQSGTGVAAKRVDFAYDAAGRRTGLTRFSDLAGTATVLVTANTYDDADRLTNLTHKTAGGTTRASYGYTLDAAGRLTSEARTWTTSSGTASDTVGYSYTADDQLTGVTHSNGSFAAESFSYDANGNRNTAGYGTTTGNRLAAAPGRTYTHDAEGNRTSVTETATGKVTTYAYDHRDRLTGATIKDASGSVLARTTYTYDALDRRLKVAAGANVLKVVYDGPAVILDFDGGNAEVARYLQGPAIDEVLARETGSSNTVAWYLQDRLGTVRDIANNSGAIVDHLGYDAFGAVTIETDPSYGDRFKFTGREFDPVTGLYSYRARWYDATSGRFLSEDPIGFGGGDTSLYRYVRNSATNATDPLGLYGDWPTGQQVAGTIAEGGSFLPIAGEIADIGQVVTGRDLYGNDLTWGERGLTAVGAALPCVPGSVVRRGGKLAWKGGAWVGGKVAGGTQWLWKKARGTTPYVDRMDPTEAARYREYWGGMHDLSCREPFGRINTYTKNGELKTVTIFDEYGRPHRQYGLREGEPPHEHTIIIPTRPRPGTGMDNIQGPKRPIGSGE